MRAGPLVVLAFATACKDGHVDRAGRDAAAKPPDRGAALAACAATLTAAEPSSEAVLAACTPCGVPWDPLIAVSAIDPEDPAPALPTPNQVLDVLDACATHCSRAARSEIAEALRNADRTPAAAWRTIAERCPGALQLDDHTRRFARGTWYALERITAALWSEDALAAARAAPPELPLPPLSQAATALALPRVDGLAPWPPRLQVTVTDAMIHTGVLPWIALERGGPTLVAGPGVDYPGVQVGLDDLAGTVAANQTTLAASPRRADRERRVALIAPRALPARHVADVVARLPGVYLAATPRHHAAPWPEPIGVIPVALVPPGPGVEAATLPPDAQVSDLAEVLARLAARGVSSAAIALATQPSP